MLELLRWEASESFGVTSQILCTKALLRILVLTNFMTKFVFKQLNFQVCFNYCKCWSWIVLKILRRIEVTGQFPQVIDNFIKLNWVSLKRNIRSQKRFHITTTISPLLRRRRTKKYYWKSLDSLLVEYHYKWYSITSWKLCVIGKILSRFSKARQAIR